MQNIIKCPKCDTAMTEGFILDYGDYDYKRQQIWIEGAPETRLLSGIKVSGANAFKVQVFRCADFNYLEFYTAEKVDL